MAVLGGRYPVKATALRFGPAATTSADLTKPRRHHLIVPLAYPHYLIYMWIVLAMVIMSWLIAFNIINRQNDIVRQISYVLYRLTEPVLGPIRRMLPDLGGLDLSPIVLLLALQFLRYLIVYYAAPLFL